MEQKQISKKEEIIEASLKLFLANGYQGTTIRMILAEVKGEVGMFYHYFDSKAEVFDEAIRLFLINYIRDFKEQTRNVESFSDLIKEINHLTINSINKYRSLKQNKLHWSMDIALHQLTINELVPIIVDLIRDAKKSGIIDSVIEDEYLLAVFLTHGFSGLIHNKLKDGGENIFSTNFDEISCILKNVLRVKEI